MAAVSSTSRKRPTIALASALHLFGDALQSEGYVAFDCNHKIRSCSQGFHNESTLGGTIVSFFADLS